MKTEQAIATARAEIQSLGWTVWEEYSNDGQVHLVLTHGAQRRGWGLSPRLWAWTEAYQAITGTPWAELFGSFNCNMMY